MYSSRQLANGLRFLSADAIELARSGHPGMPLGMADVAQVLWHEFLKHAPEEPSWLNRDRFVLSNGHGSMLLYALLHLSGYELSLADIKRFRQLGSKTPGHPEYGVTPGVEATTGPLGQGLANAVGMALSEQRLSQRYNKKDYPIIDHYTYCFVGDGCLMEGISHEVASLAGHQQLRKLIVFWDDNGISIDGPISLSSGDDVLLRFRAYRWDVQTIDGHDAEAIRQAIQEAHKTATPSLIACRTQIGYGSPLARSAKAHGSPLGAAHLAELRQTLDWPWAPFELPADYRAQWDASLRGRALVAAWLDKMQAYEQAYPDLYQEFTALQTQAIQDTTWLELDESLSQAPQRALSTRRASKQILEFLFPRLPWLLGGSADLAESTQTLTDYQQKQAVENQDNRYVYYGIREFGMSAIMNGISLYGLYRPFGATFLCFSDYARNAIRMAAMMHLGVIFVYTHDSIGLGEDGPTHQPIEHLASLRLIPGLSLWRPASLAETASSWRYALSQRRAPTVLALSRQDLAPLPDKGFACSAQGAYTLYETAGPFDLILMAAGSEVALVYELGLKLAENYHIRVLSVPCIEVFLQQSLSFQRSLLPEAVPRLAVEAGVVNSWYPLVGDRGRIIGLQTYGASAPGFELFEAYGISPDPIMAVAVELIEQGGTQ